MLRDLPHIAIIGFPNAGKTTFSFRLAKQFNRPLIHLDQHFNPNPRTALKQLGNTGFMIQEYQTLETVNDHTPSIIDCGGGTPLYPPSHQWLKRCQKCIYIDRSLIWFISQLDKDYARYPKNLAAWWVNRHYRYLQLATHRYSSLHLDSMEQTDNLKEPTSILID